MDIQQKLEIIKEACDSKRGTDIEVIDLKGKSSVADFFVIASGGSSNQVSAIAEEVEDKMSEVGIEPYNAEGKNSRRWIIIDYSDIIVHVFHKEEREYYNLERLWTEGNLKTKEEK